MIRKRLQPAPKVLRLCSVCGKIAKCYEKRKQCCDCLNKKQKQYRIDYGSADAVIAWQKRNSEYQREYQHDYWLKNKTQIKQRRAEL